MNNALCNRGGSNIGHRTSNIDEVDFHSVHKKCSDFQALFLARLENPELLARQKCIRDLFVVLCPLSLVPCPLSRSPNHEYVLRMMWHFLPETIVGKGNSGHDLDMKS